MRKQTIVLYVLLVLILPQLLFNMVTRLTEIDDEKIDSFIEEQNESTANDLQWRICINDHGALMELPIEDYIVGVVLAEMPADFEVEALKAQAVASRTFTLKKALNSKHDDAHVCTDPACCQAFIAPDTYSGSASSLERVRLAVLETRGEVVTFQGNLIEATYFSCSGGKTESAAAVWGTNVPYLQSVASPGEEISGSFETTESFSYSSFKEKLDLPQNMVLSENDIVATYTVGGGVETLRIGTFEYSGVEVRTLLNLRSTVFSVNFVDDCVSITTKGYGHRVGMSQYGAEVMAIDGFQYDEILNHYYIGTDLQILSQDQMNAIFDKAEKF